MSRDQHHPRSLPRPARLAVSLSDAGSSGLIDVHDLRAEPPPLSLSLALARPGPSPSPPPRPWWPRIALGSALALSLGVLGLAVTLAPGSTVVVERPGMAHGQLSMHEAAARPGSLAIPGQPVRAGDDGRDRASGGGPEPDAPAEETVTPEAEGAVAVTPEPETKPETKPETQTKTTNATRRARPRVAKSSAAPTRATPSTRDGSTRKGDGSIPIECVLDPARCSDSGAAAKAPAPSTSPRPAPLPAKLSTSQLKQALAATKADARRCGPEHGVNPGTTVRVRLSIEGTTGAVVSATPMEEHAQGSLGRCVAGALGQTEFPRFTAQRMGTIYSVRL